MIGGLFGHCLLFGYGQNRDEENDDGQIERTAHSSFRMQVKWSRVTLSANPVSDISNLALSGNGKAAAVAEGLGRNFNARCRLLPLVLGAIHHADYPANHGDIKAVIGGKAVGGMRLLHIVFEYGVDYYIRRQRVGLFLIRP